MMMMEKLFYLPEAHTDFLLAVIARKLGFVGVLTVICLFALLVNGHLPSAARPCAWNGYIRLW